MKPIKNVIIVEGADGVGKTTLIIDAFISLVEMGVEVEILREPGGLPYSEAIRNLIKRPPTGMPVSTKSEILLLNSARAHILEYIQSKPDTLFILDRHYFSSLVYQGRLGGEYELVEALNKSICCHDIYLGAILITAPTEKIAEFKASRGGSCAMEEKYGKRSEELSELYIEEMRKGKLLTYTYPNVGTVEEGREALLEIIKVLIDGNNLTSILH